VAPWALPRPLTRAQKMTLTLLFELSFSSTLPRQSCHLMAVFASAGLLNHLDNLVKTGNWWPFAGIAQDGKVMQHAVKKDLARG
jgi:hypothetical protein